MWAYPKQGSYKMKLREMYKENDRFKSQAKKLKRWILKNFDQEKQYDCFNNNIKEFISSGDWMDDLEPYMKERRLGYYVR